METIEVFDKDSKKMVAVEAEATNDPNLFIHKTYRPGGGGSNKWTITHRPSGKLVFLMIRSYEDAIEIVDFVKDTVDFSQKAAGDFNETERFFIKHIYDDVCNLGKLDPDRK